MTSVRDRMAHSAMFLLARDGYSATSFSEVLAHSGAPRGSVYYHFPGGKDELIEAAIRLTLDTSVQSLERLRGQAPAEIIDAFSNGWRGILERNDCRNGCPIMAVSSGAAENEKLQLEVERAFSSWQNVLAGLFTDGHVDKVTAERLAGYLLASYEGAVLLARAERSIERFDSVDEIIRLGALQLAGATATH